MPNALAARAWDLPVYFMYPSIQEIAQLFAAAGVAELAQGLGFDLTNPFTGHTKVLTDFFEGTRTSIEKTKAQFEDTPFAGAQMLLKDFSQLFLKQCIGSGFCW